MAVKKKLTKKVPKGVDHSEESVEVSVEVTKREVNGERTTTQIKGAISEDEELNPTEKANEDLATVGLSKGITVNLGNYESARISCWISKPCKNDDKVMMDTMAEISTLLDEQLEFEVNELEEMKNN